LTVTQSLLPSKVRAEPYLPSVVQVAPEMSPLLALPDRSATVVPAPFFEAVGGDEVAGLGVVVGGWRW
jgi:hypothetical protein